MGFVFETKSKKCIPDIGDTIITHPDYAGTPFLGYISDIIKENEYIARSSMLCDEKLKALSKYLRKILE